MKNILVCIFIFWSSGLFAAIYQTVASGDWDEAATWSGGSIPPVTGINNDNIIIHNGHVVHLYDAVTFNNTNTLTIDGELYIDANVNANNNLDIIVTGKLIITGNLVCNNNAQISIDGDVIITGNVNVNNNTQLGVDGALTIYGGFTGGSNNFLTGQGFVNVSGTISGINQSGFSGDVNQNLQPGIGLSNNGAYIRLGVDDVVRIAGHNGNYNNIFKNGRDGLISSDGTIIVEGNWYNYSSDQIFQNLNASGKVVFEGGAGQEVGGARPSAFENITINNPDNMTINNNLTINHSLSFMGGSIITGSLDTVIVLNNSTLSILNMDENRAVQGNLRRYVTTGSYSFPLSDNGDYLPALVNISNSGLMHFISAKFIATASETPPVDLKVDGTPIVEFLDKGYWNFTPDNGTGVQYAITLTSRGHTNGGLLPEQHAIIKRENAGSWQNLGTHSNATQTGSGTSPITVTRSGLTGFSDFIIGVSENNPLPIILTAFYGVCHDHYNQLNWETTTEINNQYFVLSYSTDGLNYAEIATIDGSGYTTENRHYTYNHHHQGGDIYFYQLTQVDFDGRRVTFPEIMVYCSDARTPYLKFTRLTTRQIEFTFFNNSLQPLQVELYDRLGRLVAAEKYQVYPGTQPFSLTLHNLEKGVYIFKTGLRTSQKTYKIILE